MNSKVTLLMISTPQLEPGVTLRFFDGEFRVYSVFRKKEGWLQFRVRLDTLPEERFNDTELRDQCLKDTIRLADVPEIEKHLEFLGLPFQILPHIEPATDRELRHFFVGSSHA